MGTAREKIIDLLKVWIRDQWHHKCLKHCSKITKKPLKSFGALLLSEGTNASLLLMRSFCTWVICRCYSLCEQFPFIDTWEPWDIYFREIFLNICWNYSFHRVRF